MSAFAKFRPPPPPLLKLSTYSLLFICKFLKAQIKSSLEKGPPQKQSSYFVYKLNFEQSNWLEKTMNHAVFKKFADVIILETPTPSRHPMSAYGNPLPP